MKYTPKDILIEREKRVEMIQEIIEKFNKTLIFIRVNYPGVQKENELTKDIIKAMDKLLSRLFEDVLILKLLTITAEGPNITMAIDKDPLEIKRICIEIEENHPLGRCVDIDVYRPDTMESIGREEMGIKPRKCFLCEEIAQVCVRSKRHDIKEVIRYIERCYIEFEGYING
ncbi:citrate lyase holo-[acyl-carrier protein] synthase [Clostridium sp. MSJ-4]|uniref:citrate lyase holo-[acyl-carrier protein] synthase n=1 Tax=Clostridium simiarum TaxID=2841506 RepID=A0ABS6EZZ1_9CLOT|nr:citrate lyase holo-[acyl-carrier protein] synthase [Clostridium simiarum]MBU5591793.1 citrate lyase holo-[acyl-carrier protein] synthase [Clostridium simiarum]